MEDSKKWQKLIISHAIVLGLSLSIIEFTALYLGLLFSKHLTTIYQVLVVLITLNAVRKHRDLNLGGSITFLQVFVTTFTICAISGLIWAVYRFAQYKFSPQLVQEFINLDVETVQKSTMSIEYKEFFINSTKTFTNAATLAFINTFFLSMVLGGSLLSVLLGLLFGKKTKSVNP